MTSFCYNCLKDGPSPCEACSKKTEQELAEDFFKQTGRYPRVWDGEKWVDSKQWKSERERESTENSTLKTKEKQTKSELRKKDSGLKP